MRYNPRVRRNSNPRGSRSNALLRNRASPCRIFKLTKYLPEDEKRMIQGMGFGGLLSMGCATMPAEVANWLMADCFDADSSQFVFPERGIIQVNSACVHDTFGLPNSGIQVKYELDVDAINFIQEKYNIDTGVVPRIDTIVQRVKNNKEADDDFASSWLMLAVSTFLCPTTDLTISPRCYPSLVDLESVKDMNWCEFVVDHLKGAAKKLARKILSRAAFNCLL